MVSASSTSHLFLDPEGSWAGFVNKYCYAKTHRKRFILLFGALSDQIGDILLHRQSDAVDCQKEEGPSNHYFKPIVLKAIFEYKVNISWLVFMDLDAWITPEHFEDDLFPYFLNTSADPVAGASSNAVLLNSAVFGLRNSTFCRDSLRLWIKSRCGFKDQLGLWNALFLEWKKRDASFTWDASKMGGNISFDYQYSNIYGLQRAVEHFFPKEFPSISSWSGGTSDADRPLLVLDEVLRFPFLDMHPNRGPGVQLRCNIDVDRDFWKKNGKRQFHMGRRKESCHAPFVCHQKCLRRSTLKQENCSNGQGICYEAVHEHDQKWWEKRNKLPFENVDGCGCKYLDACTVPTSLKCGSTTGFSVIAD